jgi:hypothetical protein
VNVGALADIYVAAVIELARAHGDVTEAHAVMPERDGVSCLVIRVARPAAERLGNLWPISRRLPGAEETGRGGPAGTLAGEVAAAMLWTPPVKAFRSFGRAFLLNASPAARRGSHAADDIAGPEPYHRLRPIPMQVRDMAAQGDTVVPQKARAFTIGRIQVQARECSVRVRTGPATAAPSRFTARVQTGTPDLEVIIDVLLEAAGLPIVGQLAVRPGPGTRSRRQRCGEFC